MASSIAREIGNAVQKAARNKGKGWYTPHMAAAASAVATRIGLVDVVVEVRDARIPCASAYPLRKQQWPSKPWIIALNKMDLADRSQTQALYSMKHCFECIEWSKYFEQRNWVSYAVNSHNKDNVKEFLNFLQSQVRAMNKDNPRQTRNMMIVGIPNVGKSALANSLHQIGRISALGDSLSVSVSLYLSIYLQYILNFMFLPLLVFKERGKFRYATVSPHPGETKDIISLKIASHPNIYILDTPGILPPEILDIEACSKLALTGAIKDCFVGEEKLAQFFLAILTLSSEYKKWATAGKGSLIRDAKAGNPSSLKPEGKCRDHSSTDHTQDFIVHEARQSLFKSITSFQGDLRNEKDLTELIETQFAALEETFRIPAGLGDEGRTNVACKLMNLYRTGRLGHYTLDKPPFPK
ncbi:DAR GTPase 2, mitochondrial [Linum perenne]